jgi:membrane protein required for colicin V production
MSELSGFSPPGLLDLALIGATCLSLGIGLFRGLIREILSLVSWVLALWLAYLYSDLVAAWLETWLENSQLANIIGAVTVFIGILLALSVAGSLISRVFRATGLTGMDRLLGAVFGALRALLLISALLLLARFTPAAAQPWYNQSVLVPYFEPAVDWLSTKVGRSLNGSEVTPG